MPVCRLCFLHSQTRGAGPALQALHCGPGATGGPPGTKGPTAAPATWNPPSRLCARVRSRATGWRTGQPWDAGRRARRRWRQERLDAAAGWAARSTAAGDRGHQSAGADGGAGGLARRRTGGRSHNVLHACDGSQHLSALRLDLAQGIGLTSARAAASVGRSPIPIPIQRAAPASSASRMEGVNRLPDQGPLRNIQ